MLFYFNINVCRDLPYVIYHKQYVTVYLKLHNLRLALGVNIKTVRLCIKTGFRLERFQSKQDLLYSWNTSVLSCVWIQKHFQGIKKGGGDPMHFLVALLCEFKRKFEFFRWRVGVFNYHVFVCMCSLIYKEGVLTSRFKKTLDSKLKDKLKETIAQKFFFDPNFF